MRFRISIGLIGLLVLAGSAGQPGREACRWGSVRYSVATYRDEPFIKAQYQQLFDSLLYRPTYQCLCQTPIRHLPKNVGDASRWRLTPATSVIVEPLMVDVTTMDGVYARRTYGLRRRDRSPRFRCGFFHVLFLVADHQYYPLSRDTLANQALMARVFQGRFPPADVARMQQHYPDDYLCNSFTFMPPDLIRRGPRVLFDLHRLAADSTRR